MTLAAQRGHDLMSRITAVSLPFELIQQILGRSGWGRVKIGPQADYEIIALLIRSVEPLEGVISVSQVGIELSNAVRRRVAGFALCLASVDRLPSCALPTC